MNARKAIWCCLAGVVIGSVARAQSAPQYAFRITFTDKKGTEDLNFPLTFLSARSLARRTTHHISVDSTDLPVSPDYTDSVVKLTGGIIHVTSRWLNDRVFLLADSSLMSNIRHKPYVSGTQFIAYYPAGLHNRNSKSTKFSREERTVSPLNNTTAGSATYYGQTYAQTVMVNGDYLHDAGLKGQGMLIAVIDAGFIDVNTHAGFDSLRSSGRLLDIHNFVHHNEDIYSYDTHGMEVLSTLAGYLPGLYVGSAPLAQYALYVTEDNNSEQPIEMDNMLAATERADSMGADVISVSLGYNTFDNDVPLFGLTYADLNGTGTVADKAANIATTKGILYVASAGNEGGNSWNHILTPGDADSSLTVGAVDVNRVYVGFSGHGPNAAGVQKPDMCDLGADVSIFISGPGDRLAVGSGTSFSTPQIAGWSACLLQGSKAATPYLIRNAIIRSADHYSTPNNDIGYGIPDFSLAAHLLVVPDTPADTSGSWITVTPNPFTTLLKVTLRLPTVQMVTFQLMDVSGRIIMNYQQLIDTWNTRNVRLPVPDGLPGGIYLLKVSAATQQQVVKLVRS
ncbi:MAG: S8 family peptidase [Taibaiella sp.]|nr:S8 family peptidase [Taibaiella sp.]